MEYCTLYRTSPVRYRGTGIPIPSCLYYYTVSTGTGSRPRLLFATIMSINKFLQLPTFMRQEPRIAK